MFGVPHPDLGEEVMAVVVAEGETSPDRLQEQLREPRVIRRAEPMVASEEKLPVNLTGKVDKAALKAEARGLPRPIRRSASHDRDAVLQRHAAAALFQGPDCLRFSDASSNG